MANSEQSSPTRADQVDVGRTGPSQTALTAAAARAAHLVVDNEPWIFADLLAARLLGEQAEHLLSYHRTSGAHPVLAGARTQVTCRSRYAEDRLADAVATGTDQYLILGAGLDTFAYRSPLAPRVRIFEVDHPATQTWKRRQLATAGIPLPGTVTFVPADLATDPLPDRLTGAGFDPSRPALVTWLGVSMYLTAAAIDRTLAVLGVLAAGTELICDYMLPAGLRDPAGDTYVELVAPVAAQHGEPWLTFLTPTEMSALLTRHGFTSIRHIHQRNTVPAALWQRADPLRPTELSVIAHAVTAHAAAPARS